MKLVVESSTGIVWHALADGERVVLSARHLRLPDMVDATLSEANAEIVTTAALPDHFKPGCYTFTPGEGFRLVASGGDPALARQLIDAERDRRLALDFEFNGVMFQRDDTSMKRINGAGTLALGAIVNGAQPGDLFWHGELDPFGWIATDNSVVQMDAQTMFAFGQAAAAVESRMVFAAKALRDMDPIPSDFADNSYWSV